MNRVLVEVQVPILEAKYNVFVPLNKTVAHVCTLIAQVVHELSEGNFPVTEKLLLYSAETGQPYAGEYTIMDSGIQNGTVLILL